MENNKALLLAAALKAIQNREVYDLKRNEYVWVNKLLFWGDELVIHGYSLQYKASEYGKTWRLLEDNDLEQRYTLHSYFEQYLDKISKEEKE